MAVKQRKTREVTEFGDFQSPLELALLATKLLYQIGIRPKAILEPTCGRGAFVAAASTCFPEAGVIVGVDINRSYLDFADNLLVNKDKRIELHHGDFFQFDWNSIINRFIDPILLIGNPPWVTSSNLGAIESENLPEKSNFHGRQGIEAITGKSNFDISEWMLLRYLDWLNDRSGIIAVLCKTAVARKILLHAWKKHFPLHSARIYKINALEHFNAAVDACFFVLEIKPEANSLTCEIFENFNEKVPSHTLGFIDGHIITDVRLFNKNRHLLGPEDHYTWRSGIKHDCSKVMELEITPGGYQNGLNENVYLEENFLFPMLKSSDIGNGRVHCRSKMVVTQKLVGEDTKHIQLIAPKTWDYLQQHAELLNKRGSVIYKKKPKFSVFGVGPYSFAPWKIAISGFYKKLRFVKIGPLNDGPVVFDDTIYFLPCWSEDEANFIESLLLSKPAEEFFHSMIHWDEKRPITVEILKRLNIAKLADQLGRSEEYEFFISRESPLVVKKKKLARVTSHSDNLSQDLFA